MVSQLEVARSRFKVKDLPALLLLHRPWRCKSCGERIYLLTAGSWKRRCLDHLWMHCGVFAFLSILTLVIVINKLA